MTDLKEIINFQKEFDKKHGWVDEFPSEDKEFFDRLQYASIALSGEVGEFSNFLKKILREKNLTGKIDEKHMASMKEELIDVFIYLIILSIILKVDIPKGYTEKMGFNSKRFERYEK